MTGTFGEEVTFPWGSTEGIEDRKEVPGLYRSFLSAAVEWGGWNASAGWT